MKKNYRLGAFVTTVTLVAGLFSYPTSSIANDSREVKGLGELPGVQLNTNRHYYNEIYRPQFHFTPEQNWMNDPNGLVYYKGEYHLFYQYNPKGNTWGNMSWGHAVSKDLLHWEHLDVALKPDELGMIFSGSMVVDKHNTSGLFKKGSGGLVAIFTHAGDTQQQSIAYSEDNGRTWKKYKGNPVIKNPGIADFRDPKVFWHEDTKQWVMVVAAGNRIQIYSSSNLKEWEYKSEFGEGMGAHGGVWECPDLFEIPVDGNPNHTKWVLGVDINPGAVAGGSGGQYFIGDFDGKTFKTKQEPKEINWVDYGKDFYASQSWDNMNQRRVWIAWMNNWNYAEKIPTSPWRSAMSIPREVGLKKTDNGEILLTQKPIHEIKKIRDKKFEFKNRKIQSENIKIPKISGQTQEIVAEFELGSADEFGFYVRKGHGEFTKVGYDAKKRELFVDRRKSGRTDFSEDFAGVYTAPLDSEDNKIKMHIFIDRSSVEVFGNDGERVLTNQIFPDPSSDGLEIYSKDGDVKITSLDVYKLGSTWDK
ncbi:MULTISPECIES: glycoside hydrolase family 32 protein [Bacillus]|uniref:Glycoside hydrolase n=2 Tax=Bacillus TaxID=1386 RepID=A0A0M5JAM6_9BACI|nr:MULTISPECIES: glycoside hydrolase family 32 protein [Bacillus]ALC83114.1 glycoside hydrolase [Bacillus gobiensis]MBP1082171.1 fructan beta-fructosidase [Bacillus capparidis]MED1096785.1 glycoside hydrolase family 32 protein [Bacillus capparidis]